MTTVLTTQSTRNLTLPPYQKRIMLRNFAFHETNKTWNDLKLNQTWCIGVLSNLFKESKATRPDEWEHFYLKSGKERLKKIKLLPKYKQDILQNFSLMHSQERHLLKELTREEKSLNYQYGRTKEELFLVSEYFSKHIPFPEHSYSYVYIRVIDETFLGFRREYLTKKVLQKEFPSLLFLEASSEFDRKYAIDLEVFNKNNPHKKQRLCALQIKSPSYRHSKNKATKEIKEVNKKKNALYSSRYGVPVHYLYTTLSGEITNREILLHLK